MLRRLLLAICLLCLVTGYSPAQGSGQNSPACFILQGCLPRFYPSIPATMCTSSRPSAAFTGTVRYHVPPGWVTTTQSSQHSFSGFTHLRRTIPERSPPSSRYLQASLCALEMHARGSKDSMNGRNHLTSLSMMTDPAGLTRARGWWKDLGAVKHALDEFRSVTPFMYAHDQVHLFIVQFSSWRYHIFILLWGTSSASYAEPYLKFSLLPKCACAGLVGWEKALACIHTHACMHAFRFTAG
jgi:hypothetical protein